MSRQSPRFKFKVGDKIVCTSAPPEESLSLWLPDYLTVGKTYKVLELHKGPEFGVEVSEFDSIRINSNRGNWYFKEKYFRKAGATTSVSLMREVFG